MQTVTLHTLDRAVGGADPVEIFLGSWSLRVPVSRPKPGELHLPLEVFLKWPLNPGQRVGLWEAPDRQRLHLGPVIGIIWDGSRQQWWSLLEELGRGAEAAAAVPVFFSVLDTDLEKRLLPAALCVGPDGEWVTRPCPLPDVIYDRGTYPDRDARSTARQCRNRLARVHDIPFINGVPALDKWDTYLTMAFFADTRGLCPETELLADRASFFRFLDKHQHMFLKNTWGTWGRDVISIEAGRASGFRVSGYLEGQRVDIVLRRRRDLWPWVEENLDHGDWIVQQAIDRPTLKGRVFDFRIVLQKDDAGEWRVPHILVNWAKPGELISNRPQRSEFLTDEEFRPHWNLRDYEFDALAARARRVSLRVAKALESRYGRLGELGLDIATDRDGRAWLLEANAKPFFHPGEGAHLPFLYARYLAEAVWEGKYAGMPEFTQMGGPKWHAAHQST